MTENQYNVIKDKAARIAEKTSREKGAMDQLLSQMRTLMDKSDATVQEAEAYRNSLTEKKEKLDFKWDKVTEKLEKVTDWSAL
jgi:hypothetical protein